MMTTQTRLFGLAASAFMTFAANGATSFVEDFSSNTMGPNLVVTGGSGSDINFSGGNAAFTGTSATGSQRAYLGTNMAFDLGVDFIAELGVFIPTTGGGNNIAFFGFGTGQTGVSAPGPSFFEPSQGPTTYIAVIGDGVGNSNAQKIAYADFDSAVTGGTATNIYQSGGNDVLLGSGSHRLRMSYSGTTGLLEFSYQEDSIGSFIALAPAINIADNGFTSTTGQLFFGGSGNAVFDDVSLTVVPEPSQVTLLGVACLGLILRRRR